MLDWDLVEEYTENAKGIAFDTCHKIYVLMDNEQVEQMREYGYDPLITADEMSPSEMLDTLKGWFEKSCSLRFIQAVETNLADPNAGFTSLIDQFEGDECEDCGELGCAGVCNDEDELDEDEED